MAEETIFSKIIRKEIPANIVYQDEVIPTVNDVTEQDEVALGRLFIVAAKLAKEEGVAEDGYRLIVNCNKHGGQEVFHLHMHLVGGEPLGRMLAK